MESRLQAVFGGEGIFRGSALPSEDRLKAGLQLEPSRIDPIFEVGMLARLYIVAGALLLGGYGVAGLSGWEFSSAKLLTPAPPAGASLSPSSGRAHYGSGSSSGTRSGWIIWGGK